MLLLSLYVNVLTLLELKQVCIIEEDPMHVK